MNTCPICKTIIKDEDHKLCSKCGWDLNYYQMGFSKKEETVYEKKIQIARRNWKALITSIKKNKFLKKRISELLKKT